MRDKAQLLSAFAALVDQYYEIVMDKPVMRDISSALRSDKELMGIEIAESRACGALLAAAIRRVDPHIDSKRVNALASDLATGRGNHAPRRRAQARRGCAAGRRL
ncbi:hypothetical protein [Caballeronia ptereochthonis]|uniref:hypothetical protein n=1 Tax=Caballeronia ptereochthonis TaxID=1777144 RepID=UPI000A4B5226|nr:hypothetical protein [Caballeronia ptereochthonis]